MTRLTLSAQYFTPAMCQFTPMFCAFDPAMHFFYKKITTFVIAKVGLVEKKFTRWVRPLPCEALLKRRKTIQL